MPELVWKKYGGRCSYGSKVLVKGDYGKRCSTGWEVDHGNPLSAGGADDRRNWRLACWACNRFKSDMTAVEWTKVIARDYGGSCPRSSEGDPGRKH